MNNLLKYLALSVGFTAVGSAVVGAQQSSAPPATAVTSTNVAATANGIGPKIQFATPVYDFGRSKSGEPVKYTYVFTNTGDGLLILTAVQPQSWCTPAGGWAQKRETRQNRPTT